ncbi:diacylglycerol kinase (ATP) [Mucilaginibacter gracilis]|uniref:Diacylglycerol kinase (ATP) n=1 Tax=Mucilaginibacter gracilis TaxID=423350 RepID=A0A495IZG5_9SPHI|nr:diacylglycerol kinase family protein [Mucilaginibacter gracilis]RKR81903.1 diacylglycerol kinase (ATP) [Mucilaginibacter gracilis]
MKKLLRSFGYAFKGLAYAYRTQLNFRIHLVLMAIALLLGWWLHVSTSQWLWLMLCITAVLCAELLNTAIETLTDMVSPGYHPKAGHVKDVAAAAVTITAIFALAVGFIIFIPRLILLF